MDLNVFDFNLIPHVAAQEADGDIQPTFGNIADITLPGTTASVLITANSTNVQIGTTVSVDVEVKTGSFTISEYRIVVDFDPSKLAVVDADPATPGTQIEVLDLIFQVDENSTSAAGRVTLIAQTSGGQALQVNRKIARINFQAQSLGTTNIKVVTGSTGSQLINQNGVAIASSTNSVSLNLTNQQVTSSSTSSSTSQSTTSSTAQTTGSTGTTATPPPTTIPDTALPEDIIAIISVVAGLSLATLGMMLRRSRTQPDA